MNTPADSKVLKRHDFRCYNKFIKLISDKPKVVRMNVIARLKEGPITYRLISKLVFFT